jgi:16S rRNA (cytidine1402-2'-O)-methyltransferase
VYDPNPLKVVSVSSSSFYKNSGNRNLTIQLSSFFDLPDVALSASIDSSPISANSIILALMASGLNGQNFCFRGYLPVKEHLRCKAIKDFETASIKDKQTQIFIETPYRNDYLLADFLKTCSGRTWLCIAQNISAPTAFIKTKTIEEWKKEIPVLGKVPVVFLMQG